MSSSPKRFERLVKSRFLPVTLSVLVFPGAGQCVQKRWVMAAIYGGLFVTASAWFASVAGRALYSYYQFGFEFETAPDPVISPLTVLLPFGACMLVWGANIVDVVVAALRRPPTAGGEGVGKAR